MAIMYYVSGLNDGTQEKFSGTQNIKIVLKSYKKKKKEAF